MPDKLLTEGQFGDSHTKHISHLNSLNNNIQFNQLLSSLFSFDLS